MPIDDWEISACAEEMIRQHGADAGTRAAMRADELLKATDIDGFQTWLRILRYIEELQARSSTIH